MNQFLIQFFALAGIIITLTISIDFLGKVFISKKIPLFEKIIIFNIILLFSFISLYMLLKIYSLYKFV